jgi:cytochrome b561
MNDTTAHYNPVAKILHWWIAALVILQYVLANRVESAEDAGSELLERVLMANHKSVGITILLLVLVRLGWRLYRTPPPPLPMPRWQARAASISHWGFYALLILLPLTGWLMSSAAATPVHWFGLVQLPDFIAANDGLEEVFEEVHETLAPLLAILGLLHIAAAAKHAVIDKDDALRRISSPLSIAIFVFVFAAGVAFLASG